MTLALLLYYFYTVHSTYLQVLQAGRGRLVAETTGFLVCVLLFIYGSLVFQLTRLGYFIRKDAHRPLPLAQVADAMDARKHPTVTILIPAYKEEPGVVAQAMLSAALLDYPHTRVVLLLDDPARPDSLSDRQRRRAVRALGESLARHLREPYTALFDAYTRLCSAERTELELVAATEALADGYDCVADWYRAQATTYEGATHTDVFFVTKVLREPAQRFRLDAEILRNLVGRGFGLSQARLLIEYRRLLARFDATIHVFERKHFVNLCHEPNKAMNLNSYIALMGGHYREEVRSSGRHLIATDEAGSDLMIPDSKYIITLDADSILLEDYALRLIDVLERHPEIAVAQTPYSAIPAAPGVLERIAGATTDVFHNIHQGFTYFNATYWVGANAVLRKSALDDIRSVRQEGNVTVTRYIQDRTVIEDTESTIDLVARGWRLYNYPERLSYSATPADFGALVIQRERWANGGLLILPALLGYIARSLRSGRLPVRELFMRLYYLVSNAVVNSATLVLFVYPFHPVIQHDFLNLWLPLTAAPYFALYARDLCQLGYRRFDLLRVYALNLLLLPVNLAGTLKSIRQGLLREKSRFGRTPKIDNRTAVPATYLGVELALVTLFAMAALIDGRSGQWMTASFATINFAFFAYGVMAMLGLRACVQDLAAHLLPRVPSARRVATSFSLLLMLSVGATSLPTFVGRAMGPGLSFTSGTAGTHAIADSLMVLVMGVDSRAEIPGPPRTDLVLLVNIDRNAQSISMLSLPRDLYVTIPDYGKGEIRDRINSAYEHGEKYGVEGGGAALAKRTIHRNLGIRVDRFVLVDFEGFERIVDAVGGIEIDVPAPLVDDHYPTNDYGVTTVIFEPGRQLMDGERALIYSRSRQSTSDFSRASRQQEVAVALRDRLSDRGIRTLAPASILEYARIIHSSVTTDVTIDELILLARTVQGMEGESIHRAMIDPSLVDTFVTSSGQEVLVPRWEAVGNLVETIFSVKPDPVAPMAPLPSTVERALIAPDYATWPVTQD